jgi:organic hydroperoxide reductase OsmC/OhrA
MHPYPHRYSVSARGAAGGSVTVWGEGLPALDTSPPPQFGGPDGVWSPETLLAAAVADCLILSFRGVARAAKFDWTDLAVNVEAVLDRVEGRSRFVHFATHASITLREGGDPVVAKALLERADHGCLVANSLSGTRSLKVSVLYV